MQGEYSPVMPNSVQVGVTRLPEEKAIVQRIVFDVNKVPIKKIRSLTNNKDGKTKIVYVEFLLRNDTYQRFGNAALWEDNKTVKESSISIPPYHYIRSITFFGDEESNMMASTLKSSRHEPLQVPDFCGFALDIIP